MYVSICRSRLVVVVVVAVACLVRACVLCRAHPRVGCLVLGAPLSLPVPRTWCLSDLARPAMSTSAFPNSNLPTWACRFGPLRALFDAPRVFCALFGARKRSLPLRLLTACLGTRVVGAHAALLAASAGCTIYLSIYLYLDLYLYLLVTIKDTGDHEKLS